MTKDMKTTLNLKYTLKPGTREAMLAELKTVLDLCSHEPEFITAILQETAERPSEKLLFEVWSGSHDDFVRVQGGKPYRKEYLTLGTRRRREQGKGSRALTHAAFTISLMRYCAANNLQHPGLVVLDSPLVTFRDKDAGTSSIDALSGEAQLQVKDEFYRDLASRVAEQQLIIFENEEPDVSIQKDIFFHHFTGDPALPRCGFFPVPSTSEDSA